MAYPGNTVSKIKTLNASFLVVGTSIGAAILGLPVETGRGGFLPSLLLLFLNWCIMTGTALLLVEVLAKNKINANFISLSDKILGKSFKLITFFVYIALFLSLIFAYVKGGGVYIADIANSIPITLGCLIFLIFFVPLIVFGAKVLSIGNTFLTIVLMGSFALLIFLGISKISPSLLEHMDWKLGWLSFPMYITSFGFHSVLPSLNTYLDNKKSLRLAVIIGTSITFLIYVIWQLVVMGIVPLHGTPSLSEALSADQTAITPLKFYLKSSLLSFCAQAFYFTAITTSFLGVALGLIDFLLDSFGIKPKLINRLFLCLVIFLPALWLAQTSLRVFYLSLKYGGGFACLYLLVFLPIALFLKNRRFKFRLFN